MTDRLIRLRSAVPDDRAAVVALLTEAKLPIDGLDQHFGPAYVVAEVEHETVAVEGVERYHSAGLLRSALVKPPWRGLGLGQRQTLDRIRWARAAGVHELWLLTTTAVDYFPRFGFVPADREAAPAAVKDSVEFRTACPASAVAMRLEL